MPTSTAQASLRSAFEIVKLHSRKSERTETSAERSAAREDDVGPSATFRVASPLVMATRGRKVRFSRTHSGAFGVLESYTTTLLLRRTVVPHETMSDARINCSGFAALRLRRRQSSHMLPHAPRPARVVEHRMASIRRGWPLRLVHAKRRFLAPLPIRAPDAKARREPE